MEKDYTPAEIKEEIDRIKTTLLNSSKQLKFSAQKVIDSSAMDLTSNLILLKQSIFEFDRDVQNFDIKNL